MKILKSRTSFITKIISTIPFFCSFAIVSNQPAQALNITSTNNGITLVETITGSGVTIEPSSINFIGADGSSGIFTDGIASGIGIESGVILTTGQAVNAIGPNDFDFTTSVNRVPGDRDLDLLAEPSTSDASVLEFQFESTGGDIFLKYVFASEAYNEFDSLPRERSDVLGFFLNGENIALVPGTQSPVSVATVNDGNFLGNNNSQFYNNNDISDGGGAFNIEYDGFTDVFTAKFLGLTPGFHTLKLAIADGSEDSIIDSAVFIAAGSLTDSNSIAVPEPTSILSLLGMIIIGSTTLTKKNNVN